MCHSISLAILLVTLQAPHQTAMLFLLRIQSQMVDSTDQGRKAWRIPRCLQGEDYEMAEKGLLPAYMLPHSDAAFRLGSTMLLKAPEEAATAARSRSLSA